MSVDDASGNIENDTHAVFGLANEQITLPNCFAAKKARLLRARKFAVCLHFFKLLYVAKILFCLLSISLDYSCSKQNFKSVFIRYCRLP